MSWPNAIVAVVVTVSFTGLIAWIVWVTEDTRR